MSTDIATTRNGMATAAEEAYREYRDEPTKANLDKLIDLIPSLIAEIDEAQRWAITSRRHREAIEGRLREARALLQDVRDYVGGHDDGEVDVWSLRETLAGRKPRV
ncbi:hypothetical protein AB0J20_16395 [Micromonospora costi]|uniref:hypothetical protein n=1 Tax=Micromonospora costi TaxID=1530042 RepID=UPI0033E24718